MKCLHNLLFIPSGRKSRYKKFSTNQVTIRKIPTLRWPNTVIARAFADAIQYVHKACKNKHVVTRAIILFTHAVYATVLYGNME